MPYQIRAPSLLGRYPWWFIAAILAAFVVGLGEIANLTSGAAERDMMRRTEAALHLMADAQRGAGYHRDRTAEELERGAAFLFGDPGPGCKWAPLCGYEGNWSQEIQVPHSNYPLGVLWNSGSAVAASRDLQFAMRHPDVLDTRWTLFEGSPPGEGRVTMIPHAVASALHDDCGGQFTTRAVQVLSVETRNIRWSVLVFEARPK